MFLFCNVLRKVLKQMFNWNLAWDVAISFLHHKPLLMQVSGNSIYIWFRYSTNYKNETRGAEKAKALCEAITW